MQDSHQLGTIISALYKVSTTANKRVVERPEDAKEEEVAMKFVLETKLGERTPDRATALNNLGTNLVEDGNAAEGLKYLQEALDISMVGIVLSPPLLAWPAVWNSNIVVCLWRVYDAYMKC